jgi:uncharacterized protein YkwD
VRRYRVALSIFIVAATAAIGVLTITAPAQAATATATGPITSGIPGKCVDVRAANPANGTPVQLYDCNGTNAQQWTVATDGSLHALGKCLDVTYSGTANGTLVQLWGCNGTGAQVWWPQTNGTLVNPQSGRCLDDPGGTTANGTQLAIWDCTAATNQQWHLPPGPITGIAGKCVDVRASNTANGTPVQLYDCNGTNAQQWTVTTNGSLRALGKCLDVSGGGTANGTLVQLWDCNGTGAQVWRALTNGTLVNPQSGRCLDDPGGNTANGTQLVIWDCTAATNQQWNLPQLTNMLPSNQAAINAVFAQINRLRVDNGLPPLQLSNGLMASSHAHTVLMANWCGLTHQCPGEPDLGDRIRMQGVPFTTYGENVAAVLAPPPGVDNNDTAISEEAEQLTTEMYNETPPNDGHRRNLLSSQFHHIGIDVIRATDGKIWMTQDFTD